MATRTLKWTSIFSALASVLIMACNSQLPSGLSGTEEEIATARAVLPEAITLDVGEMGDEESNSAKAKSAETARCTGEPAIDRTLKAGAATIHAFHRLADRALALGARLRHDITDPTQTQIEGVLRHFGQEIPYKADFAPFDIDGDGVADGSGMANVEPVALRMWTDTGEGYQRFICALITTRPTRDNLGAGEVYTKPIAGGHPPHEGHANAMEQGHPPVSPDAFVHVVYDRTDAAHKWNEAFVTGHMREDVSVSSAHHRIDVRGIETEKIEKTIRSTTAFAEHPMGIESHSFALHFQRGAGLALLSGASTGGSVQRSFDNVCVDVWSCTIDPSGAACAEFDTQDMAFIDPPADIDLEFPVDFPETPTF